MLLPELYQAKDSSPRHNKYQQILTSLCEGCNVDMKLCHENWFVSNLRVDFYLRTEGKSLYICFSRLCSTLTMITHKLEVCEKQA